MSVSLKPSILKSRAIHAEIRGLIGNSLWFPRIFELVDISMPCRERQGVSKNSWLTSSILSIVKLTTEDRLTTQGIKITITN